MSIKKIIINRFEFCEGIEELLNLLEHSYSSSEVFLPIIRHFERFSEKHPKDGDNTNDFAEAVEDLEFSLSQMISATADSPHHTAYSKVEEYITVLSKDGQQEEGPLMYLLSTQ
jgi:hypothetical protein